jgi:quercetin dioxygenase-like cupin family protein
MAKDISLLENIMPKRHLATPILLVLTCLLFTTQSLFAQAPTPDEHGFIIAEPQDLHPPGGPRSINIVGNPSEPGLYVIRITFPPGAGSRPHFHSQARYITVIKGTWWVKSGPAADVYAPDTMRSVPTGTFIYQPPNAHHYDMAKDEEVIVQIMGMGPVETTSIPQ